MTQYPPLRRRQIHLDFHTSEHIENVGLHFDADTFVETLEKAHVNSITLFAKCHHGWSYYPTEAGEAHPHLKRPNLLGEMVAACKAADIETPIYISVQWDERIARAHPEWRAVSATNTLAFAEPGDVSALNQLSAAWHTLCLTNRGYVDELKEQSREVLASYDPPGLFYDILQPPDCVCRNCLDRLKTRSRDATNPAHRLLNDYEVLEEFRREMTSFVHSIKPDARIFYNAGHIPKYGRDGLKTFTHLELESLPTGGWGYDHFPSSARYADYLGMDFLGQTGKFHTAWGDFGGFKHPDALIYETAQMSALGAKCLVGDQLHPNGRINPDTYASIAPAYARIAALEPYLDKSSYVAEIGILASEFYHRDKDQKNHAADDGAVRMLLELKLNFDIIDENADFSRYCLLILPDNIPVRPNLAAQLSRYVAQGGRLLLSGRSGLDPHSGNFALDTGATYRGQGYFNPVFVSSPGLADLPKTPFVVYSCAEIVEVTTAETLADLENPYFNRSFAHFCSHQHAPDDADAASPGPAALLNGSVGYVALPIFTAYHDAGQPLYRRLVEALIDRLLPDRLIRTNLPSSARASLSRAGEDYMLHLLYGAPQVRGRAIKLPARQSLQQIEIIEDIPVLGAVEASLKIPDTYLAFDALSGEQFETRAQNGRLVVKVPSLHIHRAIILKNSEA